MVSTYALLAMAVSVTQIAGALPSPLKETVLVCICLGALLGGGLWEKVKQPRKPVEGPPPPEGWRWHQRPGQPAERGGAAGPANGAADADADGKPAESEVLAFGAAVSEDALGVAIVPGNPGIPHFYCAFGEQLHAALVAAGAGEVTIYSVGYLNFATTANGAMAREALGEASITEEAAAISAAISAIRRRHSRRGVVLLGHSLGGWLVMQHMLEARRVKGESGAELGARPAALPGFVPAVVLAMPFLEFRGGWTQRSLAVFLQLPGIPQLARLIGRTLAGLPGALQEQIAWLFVGWRSWSRQHEVAMATFMRQPHQAPGVPLLARTEFPRLDPALTTGVGFAELRPLLEDVSCPPVLALFTRSDTWAPMEHLPKLAALLQQKGSQALDLASPELGVLVEGRPPPHEFVLAEACLAPIACLVASKLAPHVVIPR